VKLRLLKVRQHDDLIVDMPERGLILLSGKSGAGKTTIFDALEDIFYDNGSDLQPWDGGSPEFYLEVDFPEKLTIYKKRNPKYLEVIDSKGNKYIDKAAQEYIINNFINLTQSEFELCSYIRQEGAGSLLTLPPAEQLQFLQQLACQDINPEIIKEKVSAIIKECNGKLSSLQTELPIILEKIELVENQVKEFGELKEVVVSPKEYEQNTNNSNKLKEISAEITENKNKELVIKSLLEKRGWEEKDKLSELLDKYHIEAESKKAQKDELLKELNGLDSGIDLAPIKAKKSEVLDFMTFLDIKEKLMVIANQFYSQYPDSNGSNVSEYINKKQKELKDLHLENTKKIASIEVESNNLQKLKKAIPCPHCNGKLFIINGLLQKADSDINDISGAISQMESDLAVLVSANGGYEKEIKLFQEKMSEVNRLKSLIPESARRPSELSGKSKEELQSILNECEQIETTASKAAAKSSAISGMIKTIDQQILGILANHGQIIEKISKLSETEIRSENELLESLNKISEERSKLLSDYSALSDKISSFNLAVSEERVYQSKKQALNNLALSKKTLFDKLSETNTLISNAHTRYAAATRLKELVEFAATSALESVIGQINSSTKQFIDRMFDDDGTSVVLKNHSVTQKGEERAKIGIDIVHKGKRVKKLSSMSGGERSRLRLAFQLGLAMMHKSPFLLIDEGLTGLGEDDKSKCIEMIRELVTDRMVVIIEHGAPEALFDEVIKIY
jgi:DNA repair exonuclease SbcCD ATPase subunit